MEQVAAFCRRWDMLPRGGLVLCAVSGGRDSMALLHLLLCLAAAEDFSVAAAHFNHHLRPTADRDEAFVRDWCRERGVPLTRGGADAAAFARETGRSVEDAARVLRYQFLEEAADRLGACRIATAHHRQDNAETVLLHLLRGSGLSGLTGIAPARGRIVRPLLETDRSAIDRYVALHHIPYVEDETNAQPCCQRNRLRLQALPLLEDISPGCTERLARTAELLRPEDAHLTAQAEALLPPEEGGAVTLAVPVLLEQDLALRRRLVRAMAERLGVRLSAAHVEAVLDLGSGGVLDLPGGVQAVRKPHQLTLRPPAPPPGPLPLFPGEQVWGPYTVRVTETPEGDISPGPLTIAPWDGTGRLPVDNGSRTIKRLLADRGIPPEERGQHPALYRNGRLVAMVGVAVDPACRPLPGQRGLTVTLERRAEKASADAPSPFHASHKK